MIRVISALAIPAAFAALLGSAPVCLAQCPTIDFEGLPSGTVVSNQFPGVTFSNALATLPRIVDLSLLDPPGVTTSGTKVLAVGDPVGGIDCGFLRMQFDHHQRQVQFSLGVVVGCATSDTVQVRVYDLSGNQVGSFQNIPVNGLRRNICNTLVRVGTAAGARNIGTIEVHAGTTGGCDCRIEMIDDLMFDIDNTAPVADIQHPTEGDVCSCSPIMFTGVSYDPDETYASDRLEYSTSLRGPWTDAGSFSGGNGVLPPGGFLYSFDSSALPDGPYYFRLTTANRCGLESTSYTRIYIDNSPPAVGFTTLPDGRNIHGEVCFVGSVLDPCGLSYRVEFKPSFASDAEYQPVDPSNPVYFAQVDRGSFAQWNTVPGPSNPVGVADGAYRVRISASDPCGHATEQLFGYTVDNTPPVAVITSPEDCTSQPSDPLEITGIVSDLHLSSWTIDVLGGPYSQWHTLITDSTGENRSGLLYTWNRSGLPDCFFAIRLTATDKTFNGCESGPNATVSYAIFDGQRCRSDYNRDGLRNSDDVSDFVTEYFSPCP